MGKKDNYVDGYTALRAAQRAAREQQARAGGASPAPPSPEPAPSGEKPALFAHARRTVMPTQYEVVCHECGFSFQQAGRAKQTACPKCRTILAFTDHVIEGEWSGTLKTVGQITIKPDGVVKGGHLFASNLIVQGRIEGGKAEVYQWLDMHPGAVVDMDVVTARDLRLRRGAPLALQAPATFRHVELADVLTARLTATGLVHIKSGGSLDGTLQATRLRVDDGGGLRAAVSCKN